MGNFPQHLLQEFPARFSGKNFPQEFTTRFSCKIFPSWILIGWLPITLFQMLNFHQSLPFLNWLFPLLHFLQDFLTRFSCKNFPQDFPTRFSCKNFPQDFPARFSHKNFPQDFPATISRKIFPQQFPARFSCNNFPQQFPATISPKIFPQDFPKLDPYWLAPHHPFPNAKFPPITALLNRPTYHKRSKVFPPPFPQILWEPQINE